MTVGAPPTLPGLDRDAYYFSIPRATPTDTARVKHESKVIKDALADLPIVAGVVEEFGPEYRTYRVFIKYNAPDEEMVMLRRFDDIYDALGGENILLEYEPVPVAAGVPRRSGRSILVFEK